MSSFTASAQSPNSIVVDWNLLDQNALVDSITISESPPDGPSPVQTITIGAATGTTLFTGLHGGIKYTYSLHEIFTDSDGNTGTADFTTSTTTPTGPPPPPPPQNVGRPVNIKAVDASVGSNFKVHLSWGTVPGQLAIASFEVQRVRLPSNPNSPPERDYPNLPATQNSLDDSGGLVPLQSYIYTVIARDSTRNSAATGSSNAVEIFPPPAPPPGPPTQTHWRWCHKCQGMFFAGNPSQGVCPADRQPHDPSQSGHYAATIGENASGQQGSWRWCHKCQGMFFGGNPSQGVCPADGQPHDPSQSAHYAVQIGVAEPQLAPASVNAAWSGAGQIVVTWVPEVNDPSVFLSVYHRVGIAPLSETGASPWAVIASDLVATSKSFTDTRPHLSAGLRHIYKVCAYDKSNPSNLVCSTPVAAPP